MHGRVQCYPSAQCMSLVSVSVSNMNNSMTMLTDISFVYISCVVTAARALAPSVETVERSHVDSGVVTPCISSSQQQCVVAQRWVLVHCTMQCVVHNMCINEHNLIERLVASLQSTRSCSPSHHHSCSTSSPGLQCIPLIGMSVAAMYSSEIGLIHGCCMKIYCSAQRCCTCLVARCCIERDFWWKDDLTLHFVDTTAALGRAWVSGGIR